MQALLKYHYRTRFYTRAWLVRDMVQSEGERELLEYQPHERTRVGLYHWVQSATYRMHVASSIGCIEDLTFARTVSGFK